MSEPWPHDAKGKPLAKVSFGAQEVVPTVQYGNVTIGPGLVTKFVPDTDKDIAEGLNACVHACEAVIAVERELVLASIRGSK